MTLVEVCVEGPEGLRVALGRADRVELCAGLGEGGTTPSDGMLETVLEGGLPVVALVRPRPGGFVYGREERKVIERDVVRARERGVEGVAIGALTEDGRVDEGFVAELIARARPARVVFHRAFDWTRDAFEALEVLGRLGVDRILTSGGAARASEGRERLRDLVARAGAGLTIVAAGGVCAAEVRELVEVSGVREVHLSAARPVRTPGAPPGARLASRARGLEADEHRVPEGSELDALRVALGRT